MRVPRGEKVRTTKTPRHKGTDAGRSRWYGNSRCEWPNGPPHLSDFNILSIKHDIDRVVF